MAEDKQAELKLTEDITKATSSDEIRELLSQPRDDAGKFVSTKAAEPEKKVEEAKEPVVIKDTFLIGGKPVEFEADTTEHLLSQVKVAQQAWQMAQPKPEEKKPEPKPAFTKEELAAISLKIAQGDPSAIEEFVTKSGMIDRVLEQRGFKPEEYKQVLAERASDKVAKDWDGAVKDFLAKSDWPGGTQNEKLLKYKLAELKDEAGQPLAYTPSAASLERAYESLKAENMLFAREEEPEKKPATETAKVETTKATTVPTKKATGSTMFGTSQESGVRKSQTASKIPEITPEMTGEQIMAAWKSQVQASGQNPDDVLRQAYAGKA